MTAVIVGAGIVGLSTAVEVQKKFPHVKVWLQLPDNQVIIIAENVTPETTSDIAAGNLRPYLEGDTDPKLLQKWFGATFKRMQKLCKSADAAKYGVNCASGFELCFDKQEDLPYWHDIVLNFRRVPYAELVDYGWPQFRDGFFFTTYTLEPSQYLSYLLKEFLAHGGQVLKRKLASLDEIKSVCKRNFDLVINCTGLGSYFLVDDKELFPLRGQIYRVKAPFQKFFIASPNNYILLNNNQVILGGTRQANDYRLSIDESDSRKIWDENSVTSASSPFTQDSKIISQNVGLRPGRKSGIRLELENLTFPSLKEEKPVSWNYSLNFWTIMFLLVIHCYGHGGSGISLFFGCVENILDLCRDVLPKAASK